jgi:hypothetical protein
MTENRDYEEPATGDPASEYAAPEGESFAEFCSVPEVIPEALPAGINPDRLELILENNRKWVNGTTLKYYFFDKSSDGRNVKLANGTTQFRPWKTTLEEKNVVRRAFDVWKNVGIGVKFQEVNSREEAEVRIGFERQDGAWSHLGRDIIDVVPGKNERTMNFGWDLTRQPSEIDTAVHEIGHTLGFDHEHQNPFSGIVWDDEAVYADLANPPNRWDRNKTFFNIIRKITPDSVKGSVWDPDSIMHYPFKAGLVKEPAQFRASGIHPRGGLSFRDKEWVKAFYPPLTGVQMQQLKPAESVKLAISAGEQKNLSIVPGETRNYEISTFGTSDTVIVLFEEDGNELRYFTGDDDGGEDRNAYLKVKLFSGRKYVLRVKLYYAERVDETSVMYW